MPLDIESKIVSNCKLNPKPLYNYINCQKTCKESIRSLVDQNGHRVNDGLGKANLLNIQFASVFNEINQSIIPTLPERTNVKCVLNMQLFSVDNIDKALRKINQHKSAGTDGIRQELCEWAKLPPRSGRRALDCLAMQYLEQKIGLDE